MSSQQIYPWQIYHARFNFSEGHGYKYRPVIILGISSNGMLVVMVTSATSKLSLEHDYTIRDWKLAGLEKPSIARLDRIAEIPQNYLDNAGLIGNLTSHDISEITKILKNL